MSTEVVEEVAPPGPFSIQDPTFQGVLACIGAIYMGSLRWQSADRSLAAELAEKKAAHAAAHPEPEVVAEAEPAATSSVVSAVVAAGPGAAVVAWKTTDVSSWLAGLELPQHSAAFKSASVDGPMLLTLTEADLARELGVTSSLHRKKIMMGIGELRKGYIAP